MRIPVAIAASVVIAGCGSVGTSHVTQTFNFDFDQVRDGWTPGATDFPAAQSAAVGLFGAVQSLPAPLNSSKMGVFLRGNNVGGDLFLFQKRFFTGLAGLSNYNISVQVDFATTYHSGCTTGPGPLTNLKVGMSAVEPIAAADGQGVVRLSIDKGAGTTAAGDFMNFGDIRNGLAGCPSPGTLAIRTTQIKSQLTTLTTDANGGFWVFIGTQSSFVGQHEIYITGMKLTVEAE